jgi:hypothetical protein
VPDRDAKYVLPEPPLVAEVRLLQHMAEAPTGTCADVWLLVAATVHQASQRLNLSLLPPQGRVHAGTAHRGSDLAVSSWS